jgi:hemerythrin-like domain-containing protein
MKDDSAKPADTRMMNIVHQALRRDLGRATSALEATPPPADRQREAIAGHLAWVMDFLRAHHEAEDIGLYPAVRERLPDAAPVLDEMDRDHQRIAGDIEAVAAAAAAYGRRDDPSGRTALLTAIGHLVEVLLPHLEREEDEAMPLVSEALTEAEWRALEEEHNVKGKGMAELGREGHWLIDEASPEDRAKVVGLVPPVPRFLLLHGFARSYRRRREACWGPDGATRRVQKHGHNEVFVAASPEAVWEIVVDITRTGEWSHECLETAFVGGATHAEPGARFRGRNRQGVFRWGRECEVLAAEPPELVWRTVPSTLYPDSTVWRIRVTPTDGGTRLEQSFEAVRVPKLLDLVYGAMVPAHRDRAAALTGDLRRLGALASGPEQPPTEQPLEGRAPEPLEPHRS